MLVHCKTTKTILYQWQIVIVCIIKINIFYDNFMEKNPIATKTSTLKNLLILYRFKV